MKTICIYHSADLDGICSAAIVNKMVENVEFIGWNYGKPIPWDQLKGNNVIMVDISFQPFSKMLKLKKYAASLVWVDHHISAIEDAEKNNFDVDGILDDSYAACELTWEHFTKEQKSEVVKMLSLYDSWNWVKKPVEYQERVLNFQYGMRALGLTHNSPQWGVLLGQYSKFDIEPIIKNGKVIRDYEKTQNEIAIKSLGFDANFEGYKAICVNRGGIGSQFFESVWDSEKYDIMIAFVYKRGKYTVSFYSDKPNVDCSKIAKKFKGGGHKGAAGMQIEIGKLFDLFKV